MLHIYAFSTPNSIKVPIALEETGLEYRLHAVNTKAGDQRTDAFKALNPNAKVPVLVDDSTGTAPFVLTESAAILVHLAERSGRLLPSDPTARARVFEQLFFHASALSPAFGQSGYFQKLAPEKLPAAIARFGDEARRVMRVLDDVLADRTYVAGEAYSIADIAHFGWLWRRAFPGIELEETPHVKRWYDAMAERPAVIKAIAAVEGLVP
ncbi:glutathione S-transferase [Xenophilus aerolatus]|nr:glutathione S-transferase [Xenophilus aerolatus]